MSRSAIKAILNATEQAYAFNDSDQIRSDMFSITLSSIYEQFN
jgi:hypothetical protein